MSTRKLLTIAGLLILGTAAALLVSCTPASLSSSFSYQGVLTDGGGSPLADGSYQVVFRLYDDSTGGSSVYTSTQNVTTKNGVFSAVLSPPIEEMHDPLWLDLTVQGEHLPTRQRLYGAPYALSLRHGARIEGPVYNTSPMSATLNIANTGNGIGLAVVVYYSGNDTGEAILAVNDSAGDTVPTLRLSNMDINGRLIEAWNGDGSIDPWDDREFRVDGAGDVRCDGSFINTGGDYADMLPVAGAVEPGDVLVIGPDGKLVLSGVAYATDVAGIYSTFPGFIGGDPTNNTDESDPEMLARMNSLPELMQSAELERVPVALAGVVPCKVSAENGPIQPGDLLVTSDTPGHAMKADPIEVDGVTFYPPGTILGKAMEPLESGSGVILVLVSLN
jgi:hypothetical protein